ncbi:MAG: hypothetical protein DCC75_05525 [Proteobacteria bacterium]|nr:MAG: hypothetical protein DCC75_05525 [Pseudomonadota bacterium]
MSGTGSLSRIITGSFVRRFQGLASSSAPSSAAQIFRGEASTGGIANGLRLGAQTYATAINGLNTAISFVNLSKDTLKDLGDITDKLISIAQRSADSATPADQRRKLNGEFSQLVSKFRDVVNNAYLGDTAYLTKDGLSALFQKVGLNQEQSDAIANVFAKFVVPGEDSQLASEYSKGGRPAYIPSGAYQGAVSDTSYQILKLTNSNLLQPSYGESPRAVISSVNAIFVDNDNILNSNTTATLSYFMQSLTGGTTSLAPGSVMAGDEVILKSVDEASGYSIVESNSNYLGFNPSNYNQLFLVSSSGEVVHQYTNNSSADATYISADLSSDFMSVVYIKQEPTSFSIDAIQVGTIGENPALSSTAVAATTNNARSIRIDDSGSYFAFADKDTTTLHLYNFRLLTLDASLETLTAGTIGTNQFAFIDDGTLAIAQGATLKRYHYGDGAFGTDIATASGTINEVRAVEKGAYSSSYIAFGNDQTVSLYSTVSGAGTLVTSHTFGADDIEIDITSLARRSDGYVDVGFVGRLSTTFGDSDTELYKLSFNSRSINNPSFSVTTTEPEQLLSGSVATRPDAYRTLTDLKALKKQIESNISALDNAKEAIEANIDIVRAAGLAFLELSDQIASEEDAEEVAFKLQRLIRKNASKALSQAENLEPIVVAALTYA